MALTITNVDSRAADVWGQHRIRLVEVTFDSSYATGGESFTPASVGLSQFDLVVPSIKAGTLNYVVQFNYTTQKLMVLGVQQDADAAVTDPLDEEDSASDLSTLIVRVLCIGN